MHSLVSHFLANVTNEFRTPLAALNASVEYLMDDLDGLSIREIRELLGSIHLSVTGLQTLIENLIESTNMEAGHFHIRTGAIDFGCVVSEAIRFTRPFVERRGQSVVVERPATLPLVRGDPSRLTQVMVNLLSNASKSGPMNQTIHLGLETGGDRELRVTVADHGSSFLAGAQEDVFGRFVQAAGDRPYGVGLGLSVAKKIIEEHGGATGAHQCPEGGLIFWFTIPTAEHWKGD